jgi:hypothetical protein
MKKKIDLSNKLIKKKNEKGKGKGMINDIRKVYKIGGN